MNVLRFVLFALAGFVEMWALLLAWGFSAGPASALPYFALVGCLILLTLAAPLALIVDRVGSALAVIGAILAGAWSLAALREGSPAGAVLIAAPPTAALCAAAWHLWSTRSRSWLSRSERPSFLLRVSLAALPIVAFVLVFNARLVLALLLSGPPR